MKGKIALLLLVLTLTPKGWGQQGQSLESLFEKLMKNFEMDMEREMKHFEKIFQNGPFLGIDKMLPRFEVAGVEPFWRETEKQRILVFKVDASDDGIPFNIQIKDGHITVKGTIQKREKVTDPTTGATSFSSNVYQFQHGPVPIPSDVDEGGVKIEKIKDEVLIRFPKKNSKKSSDKGKPLPRRKGDVTI